MGFGGGGSRGCGLGPHTHPHPSPVLSWWNSGPPGQRRLWGWEYSWAPCCPGGWSEGVRGTSAKLPQYINATHKEPHDFKKEGRRNSSGVAVVPLSWLLYPVVAVRDTFVVSTITGTATMTALCTLRCS